MTNSISHRSIGSIAWRGKSPGFAEINTLLNLFELPTLLVDLNRNQIVGANSKLYSLTAFTQIEVIGTNISNLIPGITRLELTDEERLEVTLVRHKREPLKVLVQKSSLENNNQWVLLTLTPYEVFQQAQVKAQWEQTLVKSFSTLAALGSEPDIKKALSQTIECSTSILNASIITIYKGDLSYPQIEKIASSESADNPIFPDKLLSSELSHLNNPGMWKPGKKVTSELHKAARVANLQFLATQPLGQSVGQSNACVGLLVVGDPQSEPSNDFMDLIEIIGATLKSILDHQILVDNSLAKIEESKHALAISSSIAENAQEGIIILNKDLKIIEMNPSAELILGYASQEVIGQHIENILIGSETLTSSLKSALQGIPTQNLGNLKLHRRSGFAFPAHLHTIPVIPKNQPGNGLDGIIIFVSDLSEHEQIRVQTQQLEQRAILGEVTAIFAHEVRNPINNISTGLQLLAMNLGDNNANQEVITRLEGDCTRLTTLMESVLSFSRPMEYKTSPIDLTVLLPRILDRWRPRLTRANVQPYFQSLVTTPFILGDARALEQVFTNLISNAVHAMKDGGGTLAIKIVKGKPNQDPPQYEITVSDTGPGIPDEIRDHIFKPFVTNSPEGTGLGLAITQRIITAHRGAINVNSFPGGTVFTITLPVLTNEEI
jgi:two-component system, NtrC family, sensor histidine kinase AtoS